MLTLRSLAALILVSFQAAFALAQAQEATSQSKTLRIGIIGLDTSHCPAFTKLINAENATVPLANMRVTAAFPGGSPDIASSRDRVGKFTEELRGLGVEIVGSIDELLEQVDAVLLESVDGRKHLPQVLPVFQAGKPVFIDKPIAADLTDALAIDLLAKKYNARWFSSSSLRFSPSILKFRQGVPSVGKVLGASAWSPCALEKTHTDLNWYGVHGVETLYTAMGMGCKSVSRSHQADFELVVGSWEDGRIGTFRGIRSGKSGYGMQVFGTKGMDGSAKYEGYAPLVLEIGKFFAGGDAPVSAAETLEIFAFMQAADVSKQRDGAVVSLEEVWQAAESQAEKKILQLDP